VRHVYEGVVDLESGGVAQTQLGDVVVEEKKIYGDKNEPLSISRLSADVPDLYLCSKTWNRDTTTH
jgi:hypothetical protein